MTRQEKRGLADVRAMKQHQRVNEILAVKAKTQKRNNTEETFETDSLVIGIGPGVCLIAAGGGERLCHTEMSVAPGDRVAIRHEKVAAIADGVRRCRGVILGIRTGNA